MKNEELKKRIRQLLSALPAVALAIAVAVTLALGATSCTDELENTNSPVGPGVEAGEGIMLSFRLPEKPGFGENTPAELAARVTSTPPLFIEGVPEGRGSSPHTRAVPGFPTTGNAWQTEDEVLAKITLGGDDGSGNITTGTYHIYTTLRHAAGGSTGGSDGGSTGGSTGSWQPVINGTLITYTNAGNTTTYTNADLPLLVADPTDGTVRLRLPAEMPSAATVSISTQLYYAPGLQWTADGDNNDAAALRQSLRPGILPGTTEFWQTPSISILPSSDGNFTFRFDGSNGDDTFSPLGSRLRIYTGRPGDVITLTSPKFTPSTGEKNTTDNTPSGGLAPATYTATTDADGNAYFYGYTDGDGDNALDGTASGASTDKTFVVKGSFRLIPGLPAVDADIFAANADATVSMPEGGSTSGSGTVTGHSLAIDASFIISTAQEKFAVVDASAYGDTDEGRTALTKALTDAYANGSGKTTWQITSLAVNADGSNKDAVKAKIGAIKSALSGKSGITLYLPDATTIPEQAFGTTNGSITAITAISMPALTEITESYAFYNCTSLVTASMPKLTTITGNETFFNCTKLENISMPALETTRNSVFHDCAALKTITLPKLTNAEGALFHQCTALKTITLPKLKTIGASNFYMCTALTTVTFGSPITTMHNSAFGYVSTTNITLILSPNQKELSIDYYDIYTATNTPFSGWGEGKTFAGKTFKAIVEASE